MPRSRPTEIPQKPSPRIPPHLRTSRSDSDPMHQRARTDRSPRLAQSEPLNQKKLGTRISNLESQLGLARDELKSLKNQLSSAESTKRTPQEKVLKKSKKKETVPESIVFEEKHSTPIETQKGVDVFEVSVGKVAMEQPKTGVRNPPEPKSKSILQPENPSFDDPGFENDEINSLKTMLNEKGQELYAFRQENESLKNQLIENSLKLTSAQSELNEMTSKLNKADQELLHSKSTCAQLSSKLEATEKAKEELETEMKRLHVQTEQWRKAADAAALVLAERVEIGGRRVPERCGSMGQEYSTGFDLVGAGFVRSPGMVDESDDGFGSGKRRSSGGIRMLGDLWKKKGKK